MDSFKIGDIVTRKSYNGDVYFRIVNIRNERDKEPVYALKGLFYRLEADSNGHDLIRKDILAARNHLNAGISKASRLSHSRGSQSLPVFRMFRSQPGRVLHIDSDQDYLSTCLRHYSRYNIRSVGRHIDVAEQPGAIRRLLEAYNPDILVITGHDSLKKNASNLYTLDSYTNSKYYVQSVKEARSYQPDLDRLCIFAGACQSYYEAIMNAGANFASSPGRVLINVLDPALVSEKVALTDTRSYVTPDQIAEITVSGRDGIGGINTHGHLRG